MKSVIQLVIEEVEFSSDAVNAMASHGSRLRNRGIYGALGGAAAGAGIGAYATRKKIAVLKQEIKDENNAEKRDQLRNQLRLLYASIAASGVAGGAGGALAGRKGAGAYTKYAINKAGKDTAKAAADAGEAVNRGVEDAKNVIGGLFKKK